MCSLFMPAKDKGLPAARVFLLIVTKPKAGMPWAKPEASLKLR